MDPRDVNRINYNNYYVGQNLDFLVRSKMRSESLSTPLKNTPPFYDDQISSKMSLLGKRGFYDPGYIYGFSESNENPNGGQNQGNNQYEQNPYNKRVNEDYSNPNLVREQYEQMIARNKNLAQKNDEMNYNPNNNQQNYMNERDVRGINNYHHMENNRNINNNNLSNKNQINDEMLYKERLEMMNQRQTPQKLDNFQLERVNNNEQNEMEYNQYKMNNNNSNINKEEKNFKEEQNYNNKIDDREFYEQIYRNNNGMIRNQDKIPNQDYYQQLNEYHYINELAKKSAGDFSLPLTRNQILQGVLTENFNKRQFSK